MYREHRECDRFSLIRMFNFSDVVHKSQGNRRVKRKNNNYGELRNSYEGSRQLYRILDLFYLIIRLSRLIRHQLCCNNNSKGAFRESHCWVCNQNVLLCVIPKHVMLIPDSICTLFSSPWRTSKTRLLPEVNENCTFAINLNFGFSIQHHTISTDIYSRLTCISLLIAKV